MHAMGPNLEGEESGRRSWGTRGERQHAGDERCCVVRSPHCADKRGYKPEPCKLSQTIHRCLIHGWCMVQDEQQNACAKQKSHEPAESNKYMPGVAACRAVHECGKCKAQKNAAQPVLPHKPPCPIP